eukprot:1387772-Amorphochlora_amoeboformis.AAC.2
MPAQWMFIYQNLSLSVCFNPYKAGPPLRYRTSPGALLYTHIEWSARPIENSFPLPAIEMTAGPPSGSNMAGCADDPNADLSRFAQSCRFSFEIPPEARFESSRLHTKLATDIPSGAVPAEFDHAPRSPSLAVELETLGDLGKGFTRSPGVTTLTNGTSTGHSCLRY